MHQYIHTVLSKYTLHEQFTEHDKSFEHSVKPYKTVWCGLDWLQSPVTKLFLIILFDNPLK